jgi:putative endonuclease
VIYYVYIVECSDGTYYCGYTNNLTNRVDDHNNSGNAAKYTRSRRPVRLVYTEEYKTKNDAMKREHAIKKLSRNKKKALIKGKNT